MFFEAINKTQKITEKKIYINIKLKFNILLKLHIINFKLNISEKFLKD